MKYIFFRSVFLYLYQTISIGLSVFLVSVYASPFDQHSILANSSLCMMVFVNALAFITYRPYLDSYSQTDHPMALFSIQYVLFVFFAIEKNDWGLIYFSEIPLVAGIFFKMRENRIGHYHQLKQLISICAIGLFGQIIAHEFFFNFADNSKVVLLNLNTMWMLFPFIGVYAFYREKSGRKKILSSGKANKNIIIGQHNPKDSLFFHDMINSTHGLILFLNNKIKNYDQASLDRQDMRGLLDEVKTMQSLLKDHFSYNHKNLENENHLVNIKDAINKSVTMIQHFLPVGYFQINFLINGLESNQDRYIYYPSFYRILNNIVKNINDKNSEQVEFIYDVSGSDIEITVRNSIYHLNKNQNELSENLSKIIREYQDVTFDNESSGLGLQSIMNLCHEQGGHFRFYIEEGNWVSKVNLPLEKINKKTAA